MAALLLLAVLSVYWPAAGYDFVAWDDNGWIYDNPLLQRGLSVETLWEVFTQFRLEYWIPITWLSLLVDAELFGLGPRSFHTVNILWHSVNSLLLFVLLHRATGCLGRSWFAAALFALHPLRVESVVWATQRKDVLAAFWYLLALGAYGAYALRGGRRWYAGSVAAFALGMMAKPSLPAFAAALLVLDFWPLRRVLATRPSWTTLLWEKVPFAAVSGFFVLLTLASQSAGGGLDAVRQPPLAIALEKFFSSHLIYLGKFFLPLNLAVEVYVPPAAPRWGMTALAGAVFGGISVWAMACARRRPYLCAGWLWYVVTLLPASGLVQFGGQWLGDRFTYLPQLGIVVGVVWAAGEWAASAQGRRRVAAAVGVLAVVGLGVLTLVQERHWRNTRTLFTHALEVSEDNLIAHLQLGLLDGEEGRLDSAIAHYRRVLQLSPGHAMARTQMGIALAAQGNLDLAVEELRILVRQAPEDPDAHFNLALALDRQGHRDAAEAHYRRTLALRPGDEGALHNLSLLLQGSRGEGPAHQGPTVLPLPGEGGR